MDQDPLHAHLLSLVGVCVNRIGKAATTKAFYSDGVVIILMDCEDFCPAEKGPELFAKARAVRSDIPIIIALAYREFETWFIVAVESLLNKHSFREGTEAPAAPESLRDAKGWLSHHLLGLKYDPISHQNLFCRHMDLKIARKSHSFNRLYRKFELLINERGGIC